MFSKVYLVHYLDYKMSSNVLYPLIICAGLLQADVDVIHPFILGCDTKNPKIVGPCLMSLQRLIQHQVISEVFKTSDQCSFYDLKCYFCTNPFVFLSLHVGDYQRSDRHFVDVDGVWNGRAQASTDCYTSCHYHVCCAWAGFSQGFLS